MLKKNRKKPRGYWQNVDNAVAEARKIMEDNNLETLPGGKELNRLGLSTLAYAVGSYHGGFAEFRKLLGQERLRVANGLWQDFEYAKQRALDVVEQHGFEILPGMGTLGKLGHSSLAQAIVNYHGGFTKFRQELGHKPLQKALGVWKSLEYTVQNALEIMKEHGFDVLPGNRVLKRLGSSDLCNAIHRHHGGMRKFRKSLGQNALKRKPGEWESLDYALQQAREIMEEHGLDTLPSQKKLMEIGHSALSGGIQYHGGFYEFRKKLGERSSRTKHGRWKDLDYVMKEAQRIMQLNGLDVLPSSNKLRKLGYDGLSDALMKYHGGFHKFRKLLGQQQLQNESGVWKDLEYALQQARHVMDQHDFETLPGSNVLQKFGYSGLSHAISDYHGGFHKFRDMLGCDQVQRQRGVWKSLDYALEQAQEVLDTHGFETLPSHSELVKLGYSSLSGALVRYHGGLVRIRGLLAEQNGSPSEKEQLEGLLQAYVEKN